MSQFRAQSQLYRPRTAVRSTAHRNVSPIVRMQQSGARFAIPQRLLGSLGAGANPFSAAGASSAVGAGASFVKTKNPTVSYAAQGAAYGSTFGPIGTAVGAVVGAIGGAFIGQKRPESGLWDAYKGMAGNSAGHEYDNQFRNGAFVGLMRLGKNTFPPRKAGGYGPNDDARFLKDMIAKVAEAFRSGALTPDDANTEAIYNKVVAPWIAQWGQEPNADWRRWENQIVKDQIDAWLYDQPIIASSYTTSTWPQPRVTDLAKEILAKYSQPAPAPVTPPVSTGSPLPGAAPAPLPLPIAPATPGTGSTPAIPGASLPAPPLVSTPVQVTPQGTALDPNLQAYIKALIDQGASSQQAFTAALDAVGRSGQAVTPQVQAAVADTVQQAGAGAGLPMWAYALAGAGLVFALARPGKRKRS